MAFILGTSERDTLSGGVEDDTILGLSSGDMISGLDGNDSLNGGEGNDTLTGGQGADTLSGGTGDDLLDAVFGSIGADDDLVLPGEGSDTILGDAEQYATGTGTVLSYENLTLESDFLLLVVTGSGNGTATTANSALVDDIFSDIRWIVGSSGADHFETTELTYVSEWTGFRGDDQFNGNGSVWLRYDREDPLGGLQGVSVDLATGSAVDAFGDSDSIVRIDTVTGTDFSDTILGDADGNHLSGLSGDDSLDGQSADDTIFAGDGDDTALGGNGADYIDAGDGADQAHGGAGDDFLAGSGGDDTMSGGDGGDALDGGGGSDLLVGDDGGDTLTGGAGADHLDGGAQDDALFGGDDADTLVGGSGNDRLSGGAGADLIDGGAGLEDLLDYRTETGGAGVSVDLSAGSAIDSHGAMDTVTGIEWLAGTAMNDHLQGSSSDNVFFGTNGSDTISGGSGRNLLSYELSVGVSGYDISLLAGTALGSGGTDWVSGIQDIHGSLLNDTIHGDGADNAIAGGSGDDDLFGDAGNDVLTGGRGYDTINGGGGADLVSFGPGPFAVNADLGSGQAIDSFGDTDLLVGIENLIGTGSSDTLSGDDSANNLDGADGDDLLSGESGRDTLRGGDGADSLDGGEGNDQLSGGAGNDSIDGGPGNGDIAVFSSDLVTQGIAVDLAIGSVLDGFGGSDTISGVEHIVGTRFGDAFVGDAASNVFRGLRGSDTIDGAGGFNAVLYDDSGTAQGITARLEDALIIDQFGDIDTVNNVQSVVGTAQADVIKGGVSDESLSGGAGDDILEGGAGNDTLSGGSGRDRLIGGSGFDIADFSGSTEETSRIGFRIDLLSGTGESDLAITDDLIGIEGAIGSGLSDTIRGDSLSNVLGGGAGDDILVGEVSSPRDVYAAQSYRLYRATLDREPDQPGHDSWTMSLKNGSPLLSAVSGFVNSVEFQTKYGATSNEVFVTLLYSNVLGRAPDPGGFSQWVSFLVAGHPREFVVAGFSESAEFESATEAAGLAFNTSARQCDFSGEIFRLFRATLDRSPDAAGFSQWANARVDGTPLADVTAGFIGSQEFETTFGSLDNTSFVTQLYSNVLDRAPDAGGLAALVGALNAGLSRSAVVNGFSESAEFVSVTSPDLADFFNSVATSAFRDTIEGGAGDDRLAGGIGADQFHFVAGQAGADSIVDFERWDTVSFEGYAFTDIAEASHLLRQDGDDVLLEHPEQTIRILDTDLYDIIG